MLFVYKDDRQNTFLLNILQVLKRHLKMVILWPRSISFLSVSTYNNQRKKINIEMPILLLKSRVNNKHGAK